MTVLLGVCVALVTVAIVALAVASIRALNRFGRTAEQLEETARMVNESIAGVRAVTEQAQELIASAGQAVDPVRRAAERIGRVGDRAAGISNALLNEVEVPVRSAARLLKSVRTTAGSLLVKLSRHEHADVRNGGYFYERHFER